MQRLFLTFFGTGLSPKAPGTVGSLAGAVAAFGILTILPASTLFLISICLFLYSIKIIDDYEAKTGVHDHGSIVIDEVAGVWLAISISLNLLLKKTNDNCCVHFTPLASSSMPTYSERCNLLPWN